MISPQNASSASEFCNEELGGLRVVFINDVWTQLGFSLFLLWSFFSFLSFFLSFLCSRRCTFVPYPLTVSEYPELVLRVVNGTLGE